jgi:hypothetical protein
MRRLLPATTVAALLVLGALTGCGGAAAPTSPTPSASTATVSTSPSAEAVGGQATDPQPTNNGGGSGGGSSGGQAAAWPSPEDCISYNPNNLTKKYEAGVWTINDGGTQVMRLHGDPGGNVGDKGLALAKRFKSHCFIGRNNHRDEKYSYIFDYWRNSSGVNTTIPDQDEDCSSYNTSNISVDDMGDGAYRVKDHDHVLHGFDTKQDANNGKLVLSKYSKICFIGDGDDNGDEGQERVDYML